MSNITITHLYERVASVLGKETAENVSSFIDFKITEEMNNHTRVLATKQEMIQGFAIAKQDLTEGLAAIRQEMAKGFASSKQEFTEGLAMARQEFTAGLAMARQEFTAGLAMARQEFTAGLAMARQETVEAKAEIIKWMFIFWGGQLLVTIGIIQFIIKR